MIKRKLPFAFNYQFILISYKQPDWHSSNLEFEVSSPIVETNWSDVDVNNLFAAKLTLEVLEISQQTFEYCDTQ